MSSEAKNALKERYQALVQRLREAEHRFGRAPGSVSLVAVSKTYPAEDVRVISELGQKDFGENQVQDALGKIPVLRDCDCVWHFIGPIQSNKCKDVARHFDWAHSVDRLKIAERLSSLRAGQPAPLNILIQVNLQNESTKAGIPPDQVPEFARVVNAFSNLRLRGLMAIPAPETNFEKQRLVFARLRESLDETNALLGLRLDCLSMGMTDDLEAAIAEGATHVRIGTAIFGPRQKH